MESLEYSLPACSVYCCGVALVGWRVVGSLTGLGRVIGRVRHRWVCEYHEDGRDGRLDAKRLVGGVGRLMGVGGSVSWWAGGLIGRVVSVGEWFISFLCSDVKHQTRDVLAKRN